MQIENSRKKLIFIILQVKGDISKKPTMPLNVIYFFTFKT